MVVEESEEGEARLERGAASSAGPEHVRRGQVIGAAVTAGERSEFWGEQTGESERKSERAHGLASGVRRSGRAAIEKRRLKQTN